MNLGVSLSDLGFFEEALEHLCEAVRRDPRSADTLGNVGMTLGRMGRWPEALEFYDRALEQRPDYAEIHRNRAYGWLYTGDFARGGPSTSGGSGAAGTWAVSSIARPGAGKT